MYVALVRSRFFLALALGLGLFVLNYAAVISGALGPPPGHEAAWTLRNLDVPQYLTWLHAARSEFLLRNYHAPWLTEPALWQPLMLMAARSGLPPLVGYYALHVTLYVLACWALLYAAAVFCPGRQTWYALGLAACAIPLRLLGWAAATVVGSAQWKAVLAPGLLDFGYETADGLFRGGISNSPTLTTGTLSVLLAMALLARYAETGRRVYLLCLCGTTFVSSLLHPFEVFVIVAAAAVPLLWQRKVVAWLAVGTSGFAGMLPYIVTGARTPWLQDASETIHSTYPPFWILVNFGVPCFLTVYLLLIRFRMPEHRDLVLKSWFISVPLLAMTPGMLVPTHLLDGFAYCIGFLLMRRLACDPQLMPLIERNRRRAHVGLGALAAVSTAALGLFFVQVWQDGRRAEPQLLVNTVRPVDEGLVLKWIANSTDRETLVVSPPSVAPWVAAIPRPSFASHDYFSITFAQQRALADRFYRGEAGSAQFLQDYGVGVVVAPAGSAAAKVMPANAERIAIGTWSVYRFAEARMKPYPGLAALTGERSRSLSHRVLRWIGGN